MPVLQLISFNLMSASAARSTSALSCDEIAVSVAVAVVQRWAPQLLNLIVMDSVITLCRTSTRTCFKLNRSQTRLMWSATAAVAKPRLPNVNAHSSNIHNDPGANGAVNKSEGREKE